MNHMFSSIKSLLVVSIFVALTACSSSTDSSSTSTTSATQDAGVRITEVDAANNLVEIYNGTGSAVDVSGYYFCSKRNYEQFSTDNRILGNSSLIIPDGGYLVMQTTSSTPLDTSASDLAIYSTNVFTSANAMVDFVQWGTTVNGREAVAETKGIWTAGNAVATSSISANKGLSYQSGTGVDAWATSFKTLGGANGSASTSTPTLATDNVIITEVDPVNDIVELYNGTGSSVDVSGYFFCSIRSYEALSSSTVISGSTTMASGTFLVVKMSSIDIATSAADFAIYNTGGSFTSDTAMVDYLQWGSAVNGRESVATTKGIWTANEFVDAPGTNQNLKRTTNGIRAAAWAVGTASLGSGVNL